MKNKEKKYCYLTPDFPKEAFIIVLLFNIAKVQSMLMPLSTVIKNIDEADKCIADFLIGVNKLKNHDKIKFSEFAMIVPITLEKLFPLKKDYWTKCKLDPKYDDKFYVFIPAITNMSFHKLLVVPYKYIKKINHWELCAAYPFSIFDEDKEIEKFIYGSNQKVDVRAKYAALYVFGEAKRYNWKTGVVSEIEKTNPKENKIVN